MKLWSAAFFVLSSIGAQVNVAKAACTNHDDCNCREHPTSTAANLLFKCAETDGNSVPILSWNELTTCGYEGAPNCFCDLGECDYSRGPLPDPTMSPTQSPSTASPSQSPTQSPRYSISGNVFEDVNMDGMNDSEPPLPGQEITLFCYQGGGGGAPVEEAKVTSGQDGSYVFDDVVKEGSICYIEVIRSNPNLVFSPKTDSTDNVIDKCIDPACDDQSGTTSPGIFVQRDYTMDVGMHLPTDQPTSVPTQSPSVWPYGTVSGYVFDDLNKDGYIDNGEGPLPDQEITLFCNYRDPPVQIQEGPIKSDQNGMYAFTMVPLGSECYIQVTKTDSNRVFSELMDNGNRIQQNGTSPSVQVLGPLSLNVGMYLPSTSSPTPEPTGDSLCLGTLATPCPNKEIDPVLGYHDCGWGIWNDCTCQCVCDPGVCLSANKKCYDGCTTHLDFNPYGGCKPGVSCPWYRSKTGEPHCESSANFAGVHAIRETAELCCKQHFSQLNQDTCVKASNDDVAAALDKLAQDAARQQYFYPDMDGKLNCVIDSGYKDWMLDFADHFLFTSPEPCCQKWYPASSDCPYNDTSTPNQLEYKHDVNQGYFYPHMDDSNCRFGRNYPMWMNLSPKSYLYTVPNECCSKWYPNEINCPLKEDDGVQTGHFWDVDEAYYPNWKGNWCAFGGNYPEWMADPMQRETHLFKTAEDCCELWFPSKSADCQNNIIFSSATNPGNYTNHTNYTNYSLEMWFPNLDNFTCIEGVPPPWMATEGYEDEYVFPSHAECCKAHYCEDIRGVVQS